MKIGLSDTPPHVIEAMENLHQRREEFPRNPERDENGNAVLYPGMKRYEGVAGIFGRLDGVEYVILAPSVEGLEKIVTKYGIAPELDRDRCGIVAMERLPNDPVVAAADSGQKTN